MLKISYLKKKLINNWQPLFLALSSFLTRFLFINYPSAVVFDEVYFGSFAKYYFTGQYYYDGHPPLGKLMIYLFARICGLRDYAIFNSINQVMSSGEALILRFLPAFFSALFVLLIYFLILKMGLSKKAAFLGSFLVLFDNAILAQSKFTLIDGFLLFFGFLSFYFLLWFKGAAPGSDRAYCFLALSAGFAGLSFSIKWTGLSFLALVFLFFLFDAFKKFNAKRVFVNLLLVFVLPFFIYYSIFAIHFSLLTKSGPGDAYMSQTFQQMLEGKDGVPKLTLWEKFTELNQKMYYYQSTLTATHPYSSKWYQWPLDERPIWYWSESLPGKQANIYLVGNPLVWWAVFLAVITSVILVFFKDFRKKIPPIFYFLLLGYFGSLLPFIFITRVAFLYHYLTSLVFGILILVVLCDIFLSSEKDKRISGGRNKMYAVFLIFVFLVFLLLSPITYGFFVSSGAASKYQSFINLLL